MERIGIFGGSFDPPHIGHLQAAQQAINILGLSRLLMVPCHIAPHKQEKGSAASAEHRLAMLQRLTQGVPQIQVCDLELQRQGVSYSYETVLQLRELYPRAQLVLLMGSDMFLDFPKWKNPQIILENAVLGVFYRGIPKEREMVLAQKEALEGQGARVELLENAVVDISSTQLRRLLVFQASGGFLPEQVTAYIREQGLYGIGRDYKSLPVEALEQVVVSLLKSNRVAHVLGCRRTAVELALRWGADPRDAERAALLHDITKALDGQLQLHLCRAYGAQLDTFSLEYPKTLHALTGGLVAQRIFGENQAVVDAICSHTTGKAAMNMLEKIIYVADYMEPNRDFPGVEELRHLTTVDMDKALIRGLEMTIATLRASGSTVSPGSREALEYFGICI